MPNPAKKKEEQDHAGPFSLLGTASVMGLHMVSGPIAGGVLGYGLDYLLGTGPWIAAIGVLLGVVAGFKNVFADARYLAREQRKIDEEENAKKNFPTPKK